MNNSEQPRRPTRPLTRRSFISSTAAACSAMAIPAALHGNTPSSTPYMNENQRFRLRDGRILGFATYGDPAGWPVLYFHGIPTARIEARFYADAAARNGCRLIAIDRPGFGISSFQCGRRIVHWLNDVLEFIDSPNLPGDLHLGQFSMASFSSGAAYNLLCAARLPQDRVRSVAVISGVAPLEQLPAYGGNAERFFRIAARRPRIARVAFNVATRRIRRRPNQVLCMASKFFARADRSIFTNPDSARNLVALYAQCVNQGPGGVIHDMSLLARPWGFSLAEVGHKVALWYGECDITCPLRSMGHCLHHRLPHSHLNAIRGEGHLSMYKAMNDAIFAGLIADIS